MSCSRLLRRFVLPLGALALMLAATPASARDGLRYSPGPTTLYMPAISFYRVHAELFNTGDSPDSYQLTVTRNMPEDWTLSVCYGDICYPPTISEFTIPAAGTLGAGESMLIDLDVTKLFTTSVGSFVVSVRSNNNPAVVDHVTYTVNEPVSDPISFHFATGTTVLEGVMNVISRFHTALFNNGAQEDAYVVTLSRNQPAYWSSTICYNGVCYSPDQAEFRIPEFGAVPSGGVVDIDIDVTPMINSGLGSLQISITSEADGQIARAYTFYVSTEGLIAVPDGAPTPLLGQAFAAPNPFNPQTTIRFEAGVAGQPAQIDIYDLRGKQVRSLGLSTVVTGQNSVTWDGRDAAGEPVAAGAYVAQVRVGGQSQMVKMSLVK